MRVFVAVQLLRRRCGCSEDGEDKHRLTEADWGCPEAEEIFHWVDKVGSHLFVYTASTETLRQRDEPEETLVESTSFHSHVWKGAYGKRLEWQRPHHSAPTKPWLLTAELVSNSWRLPIGAGGESHFAAALQPEEKLKSSVELCSFWREPHVCLTFSFVRLQDLLCMATLEVTIISWCLTSFALQKRAVRIQKLCRSVQLPTSANHRHACATLPVCSMHPPLRRQSAVVSLSC